MIYVIASVRVKSGKKDTFLEIFKSNVHKVKAEKGCIEYLPAVDIDTGLPPQMVDRDVVTILEKWEGLDELRDHLSSSHMLAYREKVKDLVEGVALKVLQEA